MTKKPDKTEIPERIYPLDESQFTIVEAANHLRVSKSYLYELIGSKKIRTVKMGKRRLVQGTELKRYMTSLAVSS
jgi:excisionase family DNA binding protein